MVEVAGLPVEDVRVGVGAQVLRDQVRVVVAGAGRVVGAGPDRVDRILLRVRVQVADDQEVGVAAAGRVGREPVDQRLGGGLAREVAVALAVAGVGIADVVAVASPWT